MHCGNDFFAVLDISMPAAQASKQVETVHTLTSAQQIIDLRCEQYSLSFLPLVTARPTF